MKKIILAAFCSLLFNLLIAQSTISPSVNDEYCPETEITFTATITKPYKSMIGVGGCVVTVLPDPPVNTTFSFKGKFKDVNQKQSFRIYHQDDSFTDFDFKKIKSFFFGDASCAFLQPNPAIINAPRCQVVNIPLGFNNIQWSTNFENPPLCFGTITGYEYQLPAGWSIGSGISTGSNWIQGGNSVNITTDLSNGVNGYVYIRPVNSCGAALTNGQSRVVQVPISRPEPTMFISGGTDNLCNSPANYTINGMPAGSTVSWDILGSTSSASITAGGTSPTVTVTPAAIPGNITLRATVTHCTFTYTRTKNIRVGIYSASDYNITQYPSNVCLNQTVQFGFPWYYFPPVSGTTYTWMWGGGLQYISGQGTSVITFRAPSSAPISGTPWVIGRANNNCGSGPMSQTKYLVYQTNCWSQFRVFPNPTADIISIESNSGTINALENDEVIEQVQIFDKMGTLRFSRNFGKRGQASTTVSTRDLPNDVYTLRIFNGTTWHTQKIIVQHY